MSDVPRFVDYKPPAYGDTFATPRKGVRAANDWYQDQPEATEALLRAERFSGLSWDPACGIGTIPRTMQRVGLDALGSDIVDRGYREFAQGTVDFLKCDVAKVLTTDRIDNIVCNPPFNLAREFVTCALVMASHKVAMLLPLTFLEGSKRAMWLAATPLARVHVFAWRISMPPGDLLAAGKVRPVGGKNAYAWFVWEQGWRGPAQVHFLQRGTR